MTNSGSAPVVAFLSQKGGAGKSTLALHVAMAWAGQGRRVLLVDADPQGSATTWARVRAAHGHDEGPPALTVIGLAQPTLHQQLPALAASADVAIIDTPGREDSIGRSALMAADLVAMPVRASALDVWALQPLMGRIVLARSKGWAGRAVTVVNTAERTRLDRDIADALRQVGEGAGVEPLATVIGNRVSFRDSLGDGLTAGETAPHSKAAREAEALAEEIANTLNAIPC